MTGDSDGGVNGLGGDRADVGFIGDDPNNVFFLPASNTSGVLNLDSTTNVGFGGVWIFEVGGGSVESPGKSLTVCAAILSALSLQLSTSVHWGWTTVT